MDSKYVEASAPPSYNDTVQVKPPEYGNQQQPAVHPVHPVYVQQSGYPQVIVSTTTTTSPYPQQHQQQPGVYYVPGVGQQQIIHQQANPQPPLNVEGRFDGSYFKSGSAICRIILIIILLVGCITMGRVTFLSLYYYNSYYYSYLVDSYDSLLVLKRSYLACASILLIIQVLKIMLNAFNYGEWNLTLRPTTRNVNIVITVIESLFMLGFAIIFIALTYYGYYLYQFADFATAMIMVIFASILRSIIGCVEGCRSRARVPTPQPTQVVIVQQQH